MLLYDSALLVHAKKHSRDSLFVQVSASVNHLTSKLFYIFVGRVCVRSRCWDACMVIDGGTSFEFNDGAIASILIDTEDALCTVLFEE